MVPNFFIVGAPKCGTTSLYHYLDQHPQIYMSPIKEPSYFASELRPENFHPRFQPQLLRERENVRQYLSGPMTGKRFGGPVEDWASYRRLFENASGDQAIGEASASYLWSTSAAENIAARIPNARIVMILRDPAERAYSQYLRVVSDGLVRHSFAQQLRLSLNTPSKQFDVLSPLLEYGLYSRQLARYLKAFPDANVKVFLYEDFRANPRQVLNGLFRFLRVDSNFAPDMSRRMMEPHVPRSLAAAYLLKRSGLWQKAKRWSPAFVRNIAFRKRESLALSATDRRTLQDYYRDEIVELSRMLGRDLNAWLT